MIAMKEMDPESVRKYMPGARVEMGVGTDGKTVKRNVDILEAREVPKTKECWGVYSHELNDGKGKKYYYECWFLEYLRGDCTGVRGIIDLYDPDNKYGPKHDVNDTKGSSLTARTASTNITNDSQEDRPPVSEFDPNATTLFPNYNNVSMPPMSSVLTA